MNKKHLILISLPVTLLCSCHHKTAVADNAQAEAVDVAQVVTDSVLLTNSYPGYLSANREVEVVARVNGQILSKSYTGGQKVKAGQVLYTIESTTYRDEVTQAEAQLATAQSSYEYAQSHYEAVKRALESDAVSKMEVAQAESARDQALASIKNAKAALETARRMLGYCTVVAPFDGEMASSNYDVGAYVGGEGNPVALTTIYDNSTMTIKFSIDDDQYLALVKAMESGEDLNLDAVPISFSDSLPHTYTGTFAFISPAMNRNTGALRIECKVNNPYGELKPGMYVNVTLPYASESKALLVKDASISSDQLGNYIYTVNDSNKVVYTPVTLGQVCNDSMRIVTSGVDANSRYVTKALLKVREGMTINPRTVK